MNRSDRFPRPRAPLMALLALGAVALCALVASGPALAKQQKKEKSCAREIIEDWYDNQRVDKLYPIHCYHEAIASLGPDAENYTNLPDAILRALAYRQAGQKDPGEGGGTGSGAVKPVAYRHTADVVSAVGPGGTDAAGVTGGSSNPSSVPIPLIVLAGLAGVLLLAGGAGYVARRVQGRRGGPPDES